MIRDGDVLVHHPYDSFATSVEAFLEQASRDKDVLGIKIAMYRTSGPDSPIARALKRASQSGKQVVALVELKARGDEQANIEWAKAMEEAGVHVVYGLVGLKTHAKLTLVVRQEGDDVLRYAHIGTGNYNAATAGTFEDIALFTADPEVTADIAELFNYLTGYSRQSKYRKLLVAPTTLRSGIVKLIQQEATKPGGRIVIKVNNLVDPEVIDALYRASQAGVKIDLIVRGICCLKPGVPGALGRDSGALAHRAFPRALADLSLRQRKGPPRSDRLVRPDAPQPRPACRSRGPGRRPGPDEGDRPVFESRPGG